MGGRTFSISTGSRIPRSFPFEASSITQSLAMDVADQSTTPERALWISSSMTRRNLGAWPVFSRIADENIAHGSRGYFHNATKTNAVTRGGGRALPAGRDTQVARSTETRPPTHHPISASVILSEWVVYQLVWRLCGIVVVVPILYPLPDIPGHVIEPQALGRYVRTGDAPFHGLPS